MAIESKLLIQFDGLGIIFFLRMKAKHTSTFYNRGVLKSAVPLFWTPGMMLK